MLFSVVIPTYNRLAFLKETLASVRAQTFKDYEIIVVDDGSTDGTREWLKDHASSVRLLTQENRGPGAARNAGVGECRGDYVAFLDSDDLWFPWSLDVFATAIEEHSYPSLLGGKFLEFERQSELEAICPQEYKSAWFPDFVASSRHSFSVGSGTCVIHRNVFEASTFLEDRLNSEDHDLILQIGVSPGFVQIIAPATLAWRRHYGGETANLRSSAAGALRLLTRERMGAYPGGVQRSRERHRILARHARPIALACLREGSIKEGWQLFRLTFGWHVKLGHWKFLLAVPVLIALGLLRSIVIRPRGAARTKAPGSI